MKGKRTEKNKIINKTNGKSTIHPVWQNILYWIFLGAGIILRLVQFISGRSLWYDEAALALNLMERPLLELHLPLDHFQAAPPGFLYLTKVTTMIFGYSEEVLRLWPLLAGIAILPLGYILASKLGNRMMGLIVLFFLSFNHSTIFFSAEFKPYISDLLIAMAVTYLALQMKNGRQMISFGIAGAVAIWFSFPALFVVPSAALYLLWDKRWKKRFLTTAIGFFIPGISAAVLYFCIVKDHPSSEYMRRFWEDYFLPTSFLTAEPYVWMWNRLLRCVSFLMGEMIHYPMQLFYLLMFFTGVTLLRKHKHVLLLLLPLIIHLALSAWEILPFERRIILYLTFGIIIFVSFSIMRGWEVASTNKFLKWPMIIIAGGLMIYQVYMVFRFYPYERQEVKKGLMYIKEHRQEGDLLVGGSGAQLALTYYGKRGAMPKGVGIVPLQNRQPGQWTPQLNQLRGRVWFLFSHLAAIENRIIPQVSAHGGAVVDEQHFPGMDLYLVDFRN